MALGVRPEVVQCGGTHGTRDLHVHAVDARSAAEHFHLKVYRLAAVVTGEITLARQSGVDALRTTALGYLYRAGVSAGE